MILRYASAFVYLVGIAADGLTTTEMPELRPVHYRHRDRGRTEAHPRKRVDHAGHCLD